MAVSTLKKYEPVMHNSLFYHTFHLADKIVNHRNRQTLYD